MIEAISPVTNNIAECHATFHVAAQINMEAILNDLDTILNEVLTDLDTMPIADYMAIEDAKLQAKWRQRALNLSVVKAPPPIDYLAIARDIAEADSRACRLWFDRLHRWLAWIQRACCKAIRPRNSEPR